MGLYERLTFENNIRSSPVSTDFTLICAGSRV